MNKTMLWMGIAAILLLGGVFTVDREVGAALLMTAVLSGATVFALRRLGVRTWETYLLFFVVLFLHVAFALFVHYTNFNPFSGGGGDYIRYDLVAQEIAERVRQGSFSLEGIWMPHYLPLIIGYVYAAVMPAMVVGQLFMVWTAVMSVLLAYFLTREIGGSRPWAFLVGLAAGFYPSLLLFTSFILKEGLLALLVLLSLLVLLKLLKEFAWWKYAVFFLAALPLANMRSELYVALALTFLVSWFAFGSMELRRRVLFGVLLVFLYGLPPLLTTHEGYYGYRNVRSQLNLRMAITLKEDIYLPPSHRRVSEEPQEISPGETPPGETQTGRESTVESLTVRADNPVAFLWNQARAFAFVVAGPFPWQLSMARHVFTLMETIPWLFLLFFIGRGIWRKFQEDKLAPALALVLFAFLLFGVIAFFINNFGISMRIRIPAFLALLPFLALAFSVSFKHIPFVNRFIP